ncbi:MAG TPA: amidohydrolase [Bryobacteraceae bacterium]|nr:amidohydrolase [Bryobacteraceae bacterium]
MLYRRGAYITRWQGATACLVALLCLTPCMMAQSSAHVPLPDPYPSTYRPLPRKDILIRNATVLDGIGHRLNGASVLMRDGKIVAVGENLAAPPGVTVIDANGRWVTPGIVDPHSHIGDFPTPITLQDYKHSDVNEDTSPNTAQVWALHSIRVQDPEWERVRAGGVTTLQILPGSSNLFGGRGVVLKNVPAVTVQQMEFPGALPSLKMACGANPKETYGDRDQFPASEMGNVAGDRQAWIDAKAYRRKWDDYYAKHDPKLEPPARDLRLETLAAVLRGQILVVMHCYRADEMAVMMDMAKEFHYQVTFHHAVEAYKIVPLLKENQVCVAVWPNWWGFKLEAYDGVPANAAFIDAGGGCVMLHSDAVISGERETLEAAIAIGAGRRAGVDIPKERAIEWVTINPARSLHLDSQIGSLELGKNADVVLWSGDPFSVYTKADLVFIDGAVVYDRHDPRRQAVTDFELGQPALEKTQ